LEFRRGNYRVLSIIFIILVATLGLPINTARAQVQNISVEKLVDSSHYKETFFIITMDGVTYHIIVKANITIVGNETLIDLSATLLNPHNATVLASAAIPDTLSDHPFVGQVEAIHFHISEEYVENLAYLILPIVLIVTLIVQVYLIFEYISITALMILLNMAPFVWASVPYVLWTMLRYDSNNDDTGKHTWWPYPDDIYHLGSFDWYIPYLPIGYHLDLVMNGHYYVATSWSWWEIQKHNVYAPWPLNWLVLFSYFDVHWIRQRAGPPPPKQAPIASFEWSPNQPTAGEEVVLTSTSYDPDGSITGYHWWLGDGTENTAKNFTHVYANSGNYTAILQVTDNDGLTGNVNHTIIVQPRPEARIRVIPEKMQLDVPTGHSVAEIFVARESLNQTDLLEVTFQASDFRNPDGDIISSGNITFSRNGITITKGTSTNITAIFNAPLAVPIGWYNGNLTASSENGGNATIFVDLYVFGPPIANFTWSPLIPKTSESVVFDASSSMPTAKPISDYLWDFGDGGKTTGKMATHTYVSSGIYTVTLNVTDSEGLWDIEQKQIEVVQPHGPKAEFTAVPETANIGQLVKFDATTSQPGWNGTNQMPITEYRWDFEDSNKTTVTTPTIYHAFSSSGIYYPTLTVYASGATPETDATTHRVVVTSVPVGGYSVSLTRYSTAMPSSVYLALLIMLSVVFTTVRRKTRKKNG